MADKLITLENLTYYDGKLKEKMANDDTATLDSAKTYTDSKLGTFEDGKTVKDYIDEEISNVDVAIDPVTDADIDALFPAI